MRLERDEPQCDEGIPRVSPQIPKKGVQIEGGGDEDEEKKKESSTASRKIRERKNTGFLSESALSVLSQAPVPDGDKKQSFAEAGLVHSIHVLRKW